MANKFKVWVDSPVAGQNTQAADVFNMDTQRKNGFKAGDPASAIRVNSALRQANLVVAALMQMCDDIKTLPDTLSLLSTIADVKSAIKGAIDALDAAVLTSAKSYTDGSVEVTNQKIGNLQNQITANKNDIGTLNTQVGALDTQVETLESNVTHADRAITELQANVAQLQSYYEVNIGLNDWTGTVGNYSYDILAATHKRGTRPKVYVYSDGQEVSGAINIDLATGNIIIRSNAKIALTVLAY